MNEKLKKIHEYCSERGIEEEIFNNPNPVNLAVAIMYYAHEGQTRENGEPYVNHPLRCSEMFKDLAKIGDTHFDKNSLYDHDVPFLGVTEVCLLHDVVEDTNFTIGDIEEIYSECGHKRYFDLIMKDALIRITHDKSVPYEEYIEEVMENPISSLVKMLDLQDNLTVLDLTELNEKNYHRSQNYLRYIYAINSRWGFVEKIAQHQKDLSKKEDC